MTCQRTQQKLAGYLDGALSSPAHRFVREHLASCGNCRNALEEYRRLSLLISATPPVAPPRDLLRRIRRAVAYNQETLLRRLWDSFCIRVENMLQPLALPATGGLLAAMVFFAFVFQTLLVGVPLGAVPNDIPINLTQPARLESLPPFGLAGQPEANDDLLTIEATLNAQGEVVDYRILSGPEDQAVRRQLDQLLLFSRFRPQMSFGRPMSGGRVLLSFGGVRVDG